MRIWQNLGSSAHKHMQKHTHQQQTAWQTSFVPIKQTNMYFTSHFCQTFTKNFLWFLHIEFHISRQEMWIGFVWNYKNIQTWPQIHVLVKNNNKQNGKQIRKNEFIFYMLWINRGIQVSGWWYKHAGSVNGQLLTRGQSSIRQELRWSWVSNLCLIICWTNSRIF